MWRADRPLLALQVQDARREIESRVLRDLQAHVNKVRGAVQELAAAREGAMLAAVEELAGADVSAAVLKQLQEHEQARLQQQQQQAQQGKQERDEEQQHQHQHQQREGEGQGQGVEDEGQGQDFAAPAAGAT